MLPNIAANLGLVGGIKCKVFMGDSGCTRQTLGILLVAASGCAVTGIVFDKTAVPEWVSLLLFLLCFAAWLRFSSRVYRR